VLESGERYGPAHARCGAADIQLVHALLLYMNEREAAGRQARIDRTMRTVRQPTAASLGLAGEAELVSRPPRRRVGALVRWAVAASLLIAAVAWFYVSAANPALAALDRIVQAIDDPIDRTYEITVEPTDDPGPQGARPKPLASGMHGRPLEDRRPGLDGAVLYVRADNQFVLYRTTLNGDVVVNGHNGRQSWLIRPKRPVLISDDPTQFRLPVPENLATIPLVDLRSSLTELRHGYRLEERAPESLDDGGPVLWRHLRAEKIDSATKGPRAISLWFHPTTHLIGRVRFEQMHWQGRSQPGQLTVSLVSTQPLPAGWFDHDAHHAADVPVEGAAH
jgi:hypothetical protein